MQVFIEIKKMIDLKGVKEVLFETLNSNLVIANTSFLTQSCFH